MTHSADKAALRLRGRSARQGVSPEDRLRHARSAAERALALPELVREDGAVTVLVYGATPEELDPAPLIEALRARGPATRIAYPRVSGLQRLTMHYVTGADQLVTGAFGLREPTAESPLATPEEIDVALVPGVAFDTHCRRIGNGGGYYDRLLPALGRALRIGYAFDGQVFESVPADTHDVCVDILITPTRTLRNSAG